MGREMPYAPIRNPPADNGTMPCPAGILGIPLNGPEVTFVFTE